MKSALPFILFLFPFILDAQPVLTYANTAPVAGLTVEMLELDGMSALLPGDSGANVIWDFSSVPFTSAPAVLHYYKQAWLSSYYSFHPGSTIVKSNQYGDNFYISTSDSIVLTGSHGVNHYGYTSDKGLVISFPFTYQSTDTDTVISWGDSGPDNYTGGSINEFLADGYGTLILPDGVTLTDVLRIRIDSYETYIVDVSNYTVNTDRITYRWYKPGIKEPVLEYTKWQTQGWYEYRKAYIQSTSSILGIQSSDLLESMVYPNPIVTSGKIHLNNFGLNGTLQFYDVNGVLLSEEKEVTQSEWVLDRSDFRSGMYFYLFSNENGVISKGKFVVE